MGEKMGIVRWLNSLPDSTLDRALRRFSIGLAVVIVIFGALYFIDQRRSSGPSLTQRHVSAAEQAVKKTPNNVTLRLQLAQAYRESGKLDEAQAQFDEILRANPNHRAALLGRAGVLVVKGDLKPAVVSLRKFIGPADEGEFAGSDPQLQAAFFSLGSVLLRQGDTRNAIKELKRSLAMNPTDADALYALGTALLKNGQPEPAAKAFRSAIQFVPTGWYEPHVALLQANAQLRMAQLSSFLVNWVVPGAYRVALRSNVPLKSAPDARSKQRRNG